MAAPALPPEIEAVLALFAGELAAVGFPDVDGARLTALAEQVRRAGDEVARAREALDAAEAAAAEALGALRVAAERGLAYARVYAGASPDRASLVEHLAQLAPPRAPAPVAPRRRGRPRARPAGTLFAPPAVVEA
ncbi:MAG: hypothetical protein R2939_01090 [Kofleriaceae bacterium]